MGTAGNHAGARLTRALRKAMAVRIFDCGVGTQLDVVEQEIARRFAPTAAWRATNAEELRRLQKPIPARRLHVGRR